MFISHGAENGIFSRSVRYIIIHLRFFAHLFFIVQELSHLILSYTSRKSILLIRIKLDGIFSFPLHNFYYEWKKKTAVGL